MAMDLWNWHQHQYQYQFMEVEILYHVQHTDKRQWDDYNTNTCFWYQQIGGHQVVDLIYVNSKEPIWLPRYQLIKTIPTTQHDTK